MDMELVTQVVTIVLSFGVGLPILLKALKSADRLAALLASSLVLDGVEWVLWAAHLYWDGAESSPNDAFAIACRIGISASVICLGGFTWRTFRPESAAAARFFGTSIAALIVGFVGSGAADDWRGFRSDHVWIWVENVAQIALYGWACGESLLYFRNARRRAALGLADPVVASRFGLWGAYAGCYGLVQLSFLIALASPDGYTEISGLDSALTFTGVGALWLAFFPPRPFQTWLRASAATAGR